MFFFTANDNRYEGQWKDGKKHGKGKFFYLDRGQLYTGVWCDDIPKCGTVEDFGRHEAPNPTTYSLPEVSVYPTSYIHNILFMVDFIVANKALSWLDRNSGSYFVYLGVLSKPKLL